MPKIILDYKKCAGCGLCATLCPEFFEWDNQEWVVRLRGAKKEKEIAEVQVSAFSSAKEAADACPATAIRLED